MGIHMIGDLSGYSTRHIKVKENKTNYTNLVLLPKYDQNKTPKYELVSNSLEF